MKDRNAYLFDFATGAMSVVLALIFDKVAKGIGKFAGGESDVMSAAVGLGTDIAVLLVLMSVLATLSFAHREMNVPYRREYFILDLLAGSLLLCIAVECTHQAAFETGHSSRSMVLGLLALAMTFVFLIGRAVLLWNHLSPEGRARANPSIFQVMGFHILGICLSGGAIALLAGGNAVGSVPILICALAAVTGATIYLAFFWVFRLRIQVERGDEHEAQIAE